VGLIFSRSAPGPTDLRELRGRRLAVGPEGSGTRAVALTLLSANGITEATARVLPLTGMDAVHALRRGAVDTVFLVGAAGSPTVTEMLRSPGIALLSFPRADAYTKRFPFLTKLLLPERYHKSGPPFLARHLPFLAATLVDRVKVLILPLLVLVPLARLVPPAYRWRVRSKILKRYGDVVEVDQVLTRRPSPAECAELRLHLDLVRRRVQEMQQAGPAT
jgi:hypothetical protein